MLTFWLCERYTLNVALKNFLRGFRLKKSAGNFGRLVLGSGFSADDGELVRVACRVRLLTKAATAHQRRVRQTHRTTHCADRLAANRAQRVLVIRHKTPQQPNVEC